MADGCERDDGFVVRVVDVVVEEERFRLDSARQVAVRDLLNGVWRSRRVMGGRREGV